MTPLPPPTANAANITAAHQLLAQYDAMHSGAPSDSFAFTDGLIGGGGWNQDNGGDLKVAFYAGVVQAVEPLPAEVPPPGQIKWADGTTQSADLVSAAQALDRLIANAEDPKSCDSSCTPLKVTGAKLTDIMVVTSRGHATVPAWEFEFVPDQQPMNPITFIAVKDATVGKPQDPGGYRGPRIDSAYGNAQSTAITVAFTGSPWTSSNPCGSDYSGTVVESDRAVAVIVNATPPSFEFPSAPPGAAYACPAMGALRTVTVDLARPLATRAILDVNSGALVTLKDEPPPSFAPLP